MNHVKFLSLALLVACGSQEDTIITTADEEIVADQATIDELMESIPADIYVDGVAVDDVSEILSAKRFEFKVDGVNVSATVTDQGIEVESSDGTTTTLRIRRDGNVLDIEDGTATVHAPSEEVAGAVYLDAIRNAATMAMTSYGVNPYGCMFACYEITIGLGVYICRYYPNGMGNWFSIKFLYLPCYKGKVAMHFQCSLLPFMQYRDCSGYGT